MQRTSISAQQFSRAILILIVVQVQITLAQTPVLDTVFPAGGQAGRSVEIVTAGTGLDSVQSLRSNLEGLVCEPLGSMRFRMTIPEKTTPGSYDLWAISDKGISAPRTFMIGHLNEWTENQTNDSAASATRISLDVNLNGRIEKPGDMDFFKFHAQKGQRIIMDGFAERIDSRLRAVMEIFDRSGRRLEVSRGYIGNDPLIDFSVPEDGDYLLKIQDLTFGGSLDHIYRIALDTGPRVAFSIPSMIQKGRPGKISIYGWNLTKENYQTQGKSSKVFDSVEVDIPESIIQESSVIPVAMKPAQAMLDGFAYYYPKSQSPLLIGLTDLPVIMERTDNHSPSQAQQIQCPAEVSGRLESGDERDWYAIKANRGEVFYFEAFADRLQSPLDLQIDIFEATGQIKLASFGDQIFGPTGSFPTGHLDPCGRWVAPSNGVFLVAVYNLAGGIKKDPRRVYQLSVRREEPAFHLLAVPHQTEPSGLNLTKGGRMVLDLIAFRQRGFEGEIRVLAENLPTGVEFPDIWIGPHVNQLLAVVSTDPDTPVQLTDLNLRGEARGIGKRPVRFGTIVRSGTPNVWGRMVSGAPLKISSDAPLRITADAHQPLKHQLYGSLKVRHSPGGAVDVFVHVERRDKSHTAAVKLIGSGLPDQIINQTSTIPAGQSQGIVSFYLPPTLPVGRYSFVMEAETTIPSSDPKNPEKTVVYSNPVNIDVQPAAFVVEADPFAVKRAKRGETIQIAYRSQRRNGFIGKMHTEIAMPGLITDVTGLRGRGETFVGQTSKGSIQIIVNDDAPIGKLQFLRLLTVGVLEDEPIYQGSSFLNLEIVE